MITVSELFCCVHTQVGHEDLQCLTNQTMNDEVPVIVTFLFSYLFILPQPQTLKKQLLFLIYCLNYVYLYL